MKKKIYFCGTKYTINDSENPDHLSTDRLYYYGNIAFCFSIGDFFYWRKNICNGSYDGHDFVWIERRSFTDFYFLIQKQKTTICLGQIEHHIKFNFIRIICISFAKRIRRGGDLREGYWDVSTYFFYRFSSACKQSHKKG